MFRKYKLLPFRAILLTSQALSERKAECVSRDRNVYHVTMFTLVSTTSHPLLCFAILFRSSFCFAEQLLNKWLIAKMWKLVTAVVRLTRLFIAHPPSDVKMGNSGDAGTYSIGLLSWTCMTVVCVRCVLC